MDVGAANVSFFQAALSTTAAQIVAARTGAPGTARVAVTVTNPLAVSVYVGNSNAVTTSTGAIVPPGGGVTINTTTAIWGILSSGAGTVSGWETY